MFLLLCCCIMLLCWSRCSFRKPNNNNDLEFLWCDAYVVMTLILYCCLIVCNIANKVISKEQSSIIPGKPYSMLKMIVRVLLMRLDQLTFHITEKKLLTIRNTCTSMMYWQDDLIGMIRLHFSIKLVSNSSS